MDSKFEVIPLTDEELKEVGGTHQLLLTSKPIYAPAVIRAYFRGIPMKFRTLQRISDETSIPLRMVRAIVLRMVKDNVLCRTISKFRRHTHYYWYQEYEDKFANKTKK